MRDQTRIPTRKLSFSKGGEVWRFFFTIMILKNYILRRGSEILFLHLENYTLERFGDFWKLDLHAKRGLLYSHTSRIIFSLPPNLQQEIRRLQIVYSPSSLPKKKMLKFRKNHDRCDFGNFSAIMSLTKVAQNIY